MKVDSVDTEPTAFGDCQLLVYLIIKTRTLVEITIQKT